METTVLISMTRCPGEMYPMPDLHQSTRVAVLTFHQSHQGRVLPFTRAVVHSVSMIQLVKATAFDTDSLYYRIR